jgi:malate dehydrogenase
MRRAKITIVGAGNVGATCALWAAAKELGDIVMVDIVDGLAAGKALDLFEASPVEDFDCHIIGTTGYEETAESDVVVITSGVPRKPGMSRDDLLATNVKIVSEVAAKAAEKSPDAILVVVSNPIDAMVYTAWKVTGLPPRRVVGQAGVLDVARYKAFIALEVGCSIEDIGALLLGGHGDDMVPLPRFTTISGIPVTQFIPAGRLEEIINRTRNGGAEIVSLLKTGSAYFAPAGATVAMVESIIRDKKRVLPCAAYCEKEYGVGGLFVGVPCVLGTRGVERIIEVDLEGRERELFNISIQRVRELCAQTDKLLAKA